MSEKSPKYLLDLTSNGFRFHIDAVGDVENFRLQVGRMSIRKHCSGPHAELLGDLSQTLPVLENLHKHLGDISQSSVVIGVENEPFSGGIEAFSSLMTLLQFFGERDPHRLILQTRSSLSLVLVPFLQRYRVEVHVPMECISDRSAMIFSPQLPRPTDRLGLLSALKKAQIDTEAVFTPLLRSKVRPIEVKNFLKLLSRNTRIELQRPQETALYRAPGVKTSGDAHNFVKEILLSEGIPFRSAFVKKAEVMKEAA